MKKVVILTLIVLSCGILNYVEKETPREWQQARILCEWIGDDIYYISPYSPYALTKYNTITSEIDTISYLNKDSTVISFSISDIESSVYLIKQPINTTDFWFGGLQINFGDNTAAAREYWENWFRYTEDAQAISHLYVLNLNNKDSELIMSFPGQCQAILCSSLKNEILLNNVFRDYYVSSDTHIVHFSFSTYLDDVQSKKIDSLFVPTDSVLWVVGSLPDSSLILLKRSHERNIFKMYTRTTKQEIQFIDKIELTSGRSLFSIRLDPSLYHLTWYDADKQKVHIVDIFNSYHRSIKALSNSYCFSPDGTKIAFFYRILWPKREQRIKIESINLIE